MCVAVDTARPGSLEALLASGALRAVYQPLVELATLDVVAFEALVRGVTGTSLERPDQLFAAARADGLLAELDAGCREAAVAGALRAGLAPPATLLVNVEPGALVEGSRFLSDEGTAALQDGRLRVIVELTERELTARPRELFRLVRWLRERGCGIAIDDLGADAGSLALLPLLAPDLIKLDLALIRKRPGADLARIVHAVRAEAERTGAKVAAEGVETDEHLFRALALGADYGQGWLFGRPGALGGELPAPARPLPVAARPSSWSAATPFLTVTARHATRRGDKRLLLALSRQLEMRTRELGREAVVLANFQDERFFTLASAERYRTLAAEAVFVGAFGVGLPAEPASGVRGVALRDSDPLRGEWSVIVLGAHFGAAFVACDLGDDGPDDARRFDFAITYERELVAAAAQSLMERTAPLG